MGLPPMNKKYLLIGGVVVIAIIGAIIAVVVSTTGGSSAANESSGNGGAGDSAAGGDGYGGGAGGSSKKGNSTRSRTSTITSDPTAETYTLSAFAVGDWGATIYQDSCCSRSDTFTNYDIVAEDVVASIMDTQAGTADLKPKVVLGHGDSFYWTGINSEEGRDSRFTTTFESKFKGSNIAGIPFINVMGNHDYGGGSYLCSDGDETAVCNSVDDLLEALDNKLKWQKEYVSPNDNRWILEDHFYVHSIEDADSGVTIDIFNVDTGDADVHAALQVCCQCFAYSGGDDTSCKGVARGHEFCCGGDTDLYDACYDKFMQWGEDTRKQLAEKAAASTATWKIVNSHYSPHVHYDEEGMKVWYKTLEGLGIHAWVYGHTHGEKHDYSEPLGMHFVENGAGGGIQKEAASGLTAYQEPYAHNIFKYSGDEYGFFSMEYSADWMKLQYHTADTSWVFGKSFDVTTVGGVATKHCWYIPADGAEGKKC